MKTLNEHTAIATYVDHQKINGKFVRVESCGMLVNRRNPWIAGSPDTIVTNSSEVKHHKGCRGEVPLCMQQTARK